MKNSIFHPFQRLIERSIGLSLAAVLLLVLPVRGAASENRIYSDQEVRIQVEAAWETSWERFYDGRTHLFYDQACSSDPRERVAALPTPEEIRRQFPNQNGWGTGMEDCAISAGVMLSMICDRFEVTQDAALRESARKVFAGMVLLGTLSPSKGFVIRGVCPADRRSHYVETSRDQYTWYAYGFWRYYHSGLSASRERAKMRKIMNAICARMEGNIVPKNDYHIGKENGEFNGLVDKMWKVQAHEAARLPMLYAIGADLTGKRRWLELARQFGPEAAAQSKGNSTKIVYALLQEQVSLEALYQLEGATELKQQWLELMQLVSSRAAGFLVRCRDYTPREEEKTPPNWRTWKVQKSMGYQVPTPPAFLVKEDRTVREPAEAALTLLLCPGATLSAEQLAWLRQTVAQVDYHQAVMYGLYYTQAAYWRAARLGLMQPAR